MDICDLKLLFNFAANIGIADKMLSFLTRSKGEKEKSCEGNKYEFFNAIDSIEDIPAEVMRERAKEMVIRALMQKKSATPDAEFMDKWLAGEAA